MNKWQHLCCDGENRELKVLLLNAVCGVGSTGRILIDLLNQAKEEGHDVRIAC